MSDLYNPKSQLDDVYIPVNKRGSKVTSLPKDWDELADLEYFRQKILRATDPEAAYKYRKLLELLEDASVIYRLGSPPRIPLPSVIESSFPFAHARVRDFFKKLLDLSA